MFNFIGGLAVNGSVKFIADFFSVIYGMFGKTFVNFVLNILAWIVNFITKYVWIICKWVLGIIDAMQFGFTRLLGIDTSSETSLSLGEIVEGAKDVIVPGGSNYYDYLMKVFRAMFGVAIVLMIVFTVIAMVLQEYNLAVNGYEKADNRKGKFFKVILANIITIFLIPLIFYTIIAGASSILTSFYRAMGNTSDVTIAGNVLAASTYDANRYRTYANANKRIPITISVYSIENSFGGTKGDAELQKEINDLEVQEKLKAIGGAFANDSFLPFNKSTVYDNGVWGNYKNYSLTYNNTVYEDLGEYFENFICTREQYYVMADFIDYCQLYNIPYYIKAMSESDICWKYVDGLVVDRDIDDKGNALGDITLNVKYRDASVVNMEDSASADAGGDDTYELQITTKIDYSSPISDALTTASKLLGIDENNSKYNTMERDDSGDFTNLVSWSTEKVLLKTSQNFELNSPSGWTFSDQIIVYEYYRFEASGQSTNNTLEDYKIEDFATGVTVNALEMTYRNYNSNIQAYSEEHKEYCVKLNGTYYRVYKSDSQFDEYGHAYYMLDAKDRNLKYFTDQVVTITKYKDPFTLKLSPNFNINDVTTWKTTDQVLIYEYFKDLTLSNELFRKHQFMDFKTGVDFDRFSISGNDYVYINGTYYQLSGNKIYDDVDFLESTASASTKMFGYVLTAVDESQYGIAERGSIIITQDDDFVEIDDTDAMYQKYSTMNFRLSEDFSFFNSDTWSFRDYVIIYLYISHLKSDTTITIDSLKHLGLQGNFGRIDGTYCVQIKLNIGGTISFVTYDVEKLSRASELKITKTLNPEIFNNMNLGLTGVNLVTSYNSELESDRLIGAEVSTHKFELSEDFDAYDPVTWSVGDYLMIYLTNAGIIDTDIGMIKLQGYTSLVYNVGGVKYYRFGREADPDAFFLSEAQVEAAKYDVDKWFKTDLMSFLLTTYYNSGASELTYDETNFGGGSFINKDHYIYNIEDDPTSTRSLQYVLAKELFDSGVASTDVEKLEYTYSNPEIVVGDITTWKYLDLIIYQKTGEIPTTTKPYKSYIYKDTSGVVWFLVKDALSADEDVFVKVSGGLAECYGNGSGRLYTVQVRATSQNKFSSIVNFRKHYKQYIQTKDSVAGSSSFTAYYYSDLLKGDTSEAAFVADTLMTDIDMVLIENKVSKTTSGYYTFEGFRDGENIYIKIKNGVYLGFGSSEYDKMYYIQNSLIPMPGESKELFELSTNPPYTSFNGSYNKFDALLYSITGSTSSVDYDIYSVKSSVTATYGISGDYIKVNDRFIKYDSGYAGDYNLPNPGNALAQKPYVDYLYENFYYTAVTTTSPNVKSRFKGNMQVNTAIWHTGISVILSYYGMTAQNDNSELIVSTDDGKYLFVNGATESIYINLSGIATDDVTHNGTEHTIKIDPTDAELVKWRVYNTTNTGTITTNQVTALETDTTLEIGSLLSLANSMASTLNVENAPSSLQNPDIHEYTYLNLLSSYFDPNNTNKKLRTFYSIEESKYYVLFDSFGEQYIIPMEVNYVTIGGSNNKIHIESKIINDMAGYHSMFTVEDTIGAINIEYWYQNDMATHGNKPTTLIGQIRKDKNYKILKKFTSTYLKDENGEALTFYLVQSKDTNVYYVIYGLKEATLSSSPISYLKFDAVGGSITDTSDIGQGKAFVVETKDLQYSDEWTMVDFTISYLTGGIYGAFFESEKVYIYGGRYYVEKDGKFMLLPQMAGENIFEATSNTHGSVKSSGSSKIINLLRIGGSSVGFVERRSDFAPSVQSSLSDFESASLGEYNSGKTSHIKFSENFDIRDFSTWTISDYILYYVVVNEFYSGGTNIQIPYTYIPNFMVSGETIYNLTYFDMFMAEAYKDGTEYPYLTQEGYRNQAYTLYIVRDRDYNYYVKINGSNSLIYVKISDIVYTNYAKMEIVSTLMGDTFTTDKLDAVTAKITELQGSIKTSLDGEQAIWTRLEGKNFQTLANAHGALGQIHYLLKQDENTGSVEFDRVIEFNSNAGSDGTYFKYNKFYELYGSSFESYAETVKENELEIKIGVGGAPPEGVDGYYLQVKYDQVFPDLKFKNYYYFVEDVSKFEGKDLLKVDTVIQNAIIEGTSTLERAKVKLKLSTTFSDAEKTNRTGGFIITDVDSWTVLDYIIMREYSREGVNHNKFKDMTFRELYDDTYATIYISGENYYLYINGNFYNLKGIIERTSPDDAEETIYEVKNDTSTLLKNAIPGLIEGQDINDLTSPNFNNYNIRVLKETLEFSINTGYTNTQSHTRNKDNVAYTIESSPNSGVYVTYFKYVDTDIADANFRINVSRFGKYSTQTLIKKSSWVEKLMTDMQVYYPDLNWSTLIATDGWIDTLGDFTSAYTNGLYLGGDNSSNTTAAGLVLSEFFMSVAKEVDDSYADYEYESVFDEETLKALMLSLVGEENYRALVLEAEVFMDYFNSSFAPIIDDFAEEFGESIGENSLRLCAYKSYLATLLLSSDIGEYLYTVATRIYAEYTIGEYLANAGGDYTGYYSYVNNLKDENGNTVDSFNYGTFNELVRYENEYCGNNTPTFTFNVKKAFEVYKDDDDKVAGFTYDVAISNTSYFNVAIKTLIGFMDEDYEEIYKYGYQISDQGKVIDENSKIVSSYAEKDYVFCYMLHVYWSILLDINAGGMPSYLESYRQYIDGELTRWSIFSADSIDGADTYFENINTDRLKLALYKGLSFATTVRLYIPTIVLGGNDEDDGFISKLMSLLEVIGDVLVNPYAGLSENTIIPLVNAYDMSRGNSQVTTSLNFIRDNSISLYFLMGFSENSSLGIIEDVKDLIRKYLPANLSSEASWNTILKFSDNLDVVIAELQEIREILPGESTTGGSNRSINNGFGGLYYSNEQIDKVISSFQDLKYNITQYITSQQRIDRAQKRSITFTLAQYGANYVSSGYQFSVRKKDYTFKNTVDPSRIAEYVYGGAFLESVGVGAQYTSPDFTGIVKSAKVYDNVDKVLKTNLETWPTLRKFASNLADKTAELYFLTNLGDLDVGKVNGVKIDDQVGIGGGTGMIKDEIAVFIQDQFRTNLGATEANQLMTRIGTDFESLSLYLFSNSIEEKDLEKITFEDYKRIVLQKVIENEQNEEESAEERANKYMTLFNLMSLQFNLTARDGTNVYDIGRIVYAGKIDRTAGTLHYNSAGVDQPAVAAVAYGAAATPTVITGKIHAQKHISESTLDIIKTMSGLENRPTFEILTREYSGTRPTNYYDESYGDTFVICTYKNGLYYPVLASGSKVCTSSNYNSFYNTDDPDTSIMKHKFVSEYLDTGSYVIVAKGVVTPDGYPTAIRKYNNPIEIARKKLLTTTTETYNAVTYYRTNIGGNFGEGKDLINASRAVSRVTTKNYTKYVYGTNYTSGIGGTTTYTGRNNLKTLVKTDYQSNFIQTKVEYLLDESDSYGGISVLDDFSYFYVFGGQSWVILVLAFITIIPVMINAIGGVITRIFDLVILFIISPVIVSTNSLYPDGKNDIFKKWKKGVTSVLWSALGYIIGFSSFTLLVPLIYNVNAFVDVKTFKVIASIGGLGKFLSYPVINSLVRSLWIVTAVTVLERMPKLLLPVLTANNGDLTTPHPSIGGGGKKFTEKAKELGGTLRDIGNKIGSVVSGRAALGLIQEVKKEALEMIPGYELGKAAKEKFIDPAFDKIHQAKVEAEKKLIEAGLIAYGIDPKLAKAAAEAVGAVENSRKKAKEERKKQNENYRKEFEKNFM